MAKYRQTGQMPLPTKTPLYGDFSDSVDFHSAMNKMIKAQEDFNGMPAAIRKRFGNDPGALIDFLADANNYEEAVELGILEKIVKEEVIPENPPAKEEPKVPVESS